MLEYLLSPLFPFWKTHLDSNLISQDALPSTVKNEENFLDENPQSLVTQNQLRPLGPTFSHWNQLFSFA